MTTRGIEIGKTSLLLRGQTLIGTKYVPRQDGSGVDLVKIVCILFLKFFNLYYIMFFIFYSGVKSQQQLPIRQLCLV